LKSSFQKNLFDNFWNFLQFPMNFTRQQHGSHEIIHQFTLGSLDSCTQAPRTKQSITTMPLPAFDGVRHSCLWCSRRRRGPGRRWSGPTWPTSPMVSTSGWCASRSTTEHGRQRTMAAAASGRRRSRWGAGEHGGTRHARAPGKCGDAFPQLNLDRDRPERGDRRRGGARFSPPAMAIGVLQVRAIVTPRKFT
jgi:hypothetical protein